MRKPKLSIVVGLVLLWAGTELWLKIEIFSQRMSVPEDIVTGDAWEEMWVKDSLRIEWLAGHEARKQRRKKQLLALASRVVERSYVTSCVVERMRDGGGFCLVAGRDKYLEICCVVDTKECGDGCTEEVDPFGNRYGNSGGVPPFERWRPED